MMDEEKRKRIEAILAAGPASFIDARLNERVEHITLRDAQLQQLNQSGITLADFADAYEEAYNSYVHFTVTFFAAALAIVLHTVSYTTEQTLDVLNELAVQIPAPGIPTIERSWYAEMSKRGISERDLKRARRLGERDAKRDCGFPRLFGVLEAPDEIKDQIQGTIDEEISVADIVERAKRETGLDIEALLWTT